MATQQLTMPNWAQGIASSGIGVLALMMACLAMLVIPMPPFLLDLLFTFNIALSLVIILAVIYIERPIDFSVFPTVLLLATLLRLALNVASTRVVLLEGHTGPGAAGKVIESFGEFVIGGNYVVGMVVFIILVVINFVVVTKGAGQQQKHHIGHAGNDADHAQHRRRQVEHFGLGRHLPDDLLTHILRPGNTRHDDRNGSRQQQRGQLRDETVTDGQQGVVMHRLGKAQVVLANAHPQAADHVNK
jgi:hypothetical protein